MTNLEQAAKEYAVKTGWLSGPVNADLQKAFLAGAAQAEGSFAEWCSREGWYYVSEFMQWTNVDRKEWITTEELYQLYLSQLKQRNNE